MWLEKCIVSTYIEYIFFFSSLISWVLIAVTGSIAGSIAGSNSKPVSGLGKKTIKRKIEKKEEEKTGWRKKRKK